MAAPPATIGEAVDKLMMVLDDEQKLAIAVMSENDLIDLHFSLGMTIQNAFGLHDADSHLLQVCHVAQPDDASAVIIKKLWSELARQ